MNKILSMHRLGLLFKKDWAENWKFYLLAIPVIIILISLFFYITDDIKREINNGLSYVGPQMKNFQFGHEMKYLTGLIFLSVVAAILRFNSLSHKSKSIDFLLLPATATEKMIINWVWVFPIFFTVYSILYWVMDHAFITAYISMAKEAGVAVTEVNKIVFVDLKTVWEHPSEFSCYPIFTSIFLLGPLLFRKYAVVITIILAATGAYTYMDLLNSMQHSLIPESVKQGFSYTLPGGIRPDYLLLMFVIPALFWIITWMRIKERQV
ncbi:hypothetical protein [Solitalea lacus]|uniref:hypothetical protein n=1 Tax=Solitalea lacus TaxID=2911172 RepID=UPI001ED9E49A|nr:hypothetical protein [Solitalea lacus]UKJ07552.1 hypothetical protein L2B55_18795 [Solitalea lacus]